MARGFRLAGTLSEFLKDLDKLKDTEHSLIVWQNDAKGEKQILDALYDSYSQDKDRTIINIKLDKNYSFEKDNPVYIFEKDKGILFKGRYEYCINSMLNVLADNKVFLKEKRVFERFYFHYTKVLTKLVIKLSDEKILEEKVELRDVCPGGYGFRYDVNKSKILLEGSVVELCNIGGVELPLALNGVIVHKSKFKDVGALDKESKILVGVKFDKPSKLITKVAEAMKSL